MNTDVFISDDATLSLGINGQIAIFEIPPDQAGCYAVMLHETPSFPGIAHIESLGFTVLCAAWHSTVEGDSGDKPRWGWVHLEADTKEMIGMTLEKMGATPGKWYYMLITNEYGRRPHDHIAKLIRTDK